MVAKFRRVLEVADVAGMDDVEAAVAHDDRFALLLRRANRARGFFNGKNFARCDHECVYRHARRRPLKRATPSA